MRQHPTIARLESEQTAVESVIKLLLNSQFPDRYRVEVIETDDHKTLKISADEGLLPKIEQAIMHRLAVPGALKQVLCYQFKGDVLGPERNMGGLDIDAIPSPPADTFAVGMKMLSSLFPTEIGAGFVFRPADIFVEAKGAHAKNGVLFSCETKKPREKQMWEFSVENMLDFFNHVPVEQIRAALAAEKPLAFQETDDANDAQQKIAKGLLLECFGTVDNHQTNAKRLYFNFMKLFQLLYPPRLVSGDACLIVDLEHLTMFMKQAVGEGFLLTIDDASHAAQPIFFEGRSTIEKPLNLLFNLDVSSSMKGNEPAYKSNIEDVLSELRQALSPEQLSRAKVAFQLFSANVQSIRKFNLVEVENISIFLDNLVCKGGTALYRAIHDGVEYMASSHASNNIMVLFTDGNNSKQKDWYDQMLSRTNALVNDPQLTLTVFTLGLGEVKDEVLHDIANQTATTYFPVDRVAELQQHLISNLERMRFQHRIVALLTSTESFRVPVPQNGSFSQAQVNIPMQAGPVNITVDGESYVVSLRAPAQTHHQLTASARAGLQNAINSRTSHHVLADTNTDDQCAELAEVATSTTLDK